MTATFLFFDTETSGFINKKKTYDDPEQNWCCQIGAMTTDQDGNELETLDVIIKANGRKIPSFLVDLHGISAERADAEGIEEIEAIEKFSRLMLDMPTKICHNFLFDNEFTDHMFLRNMDDLSDIARSRYFLQLPHICTMRHKEVVKFCGLKNKAGKPKWPKLEELYQILFDKDFPNAHNAMADTRATKECFFELVKREIILI